MVNRKMFVFVLAVLLLLLGVFTTAAAQELKLYGITATDEHPNGCVDCHAKTGGGDYRLNVELDALGGHPPITAIVKTVPGDCLMCHKDGSNAGPLDLITHKFHYQTPRDNHFISGYEGSCLQCHSLNTSNWQMTVKSGPKNW